MAEVVSTSGGSEDSDLNATRTRLSGHLDQLRERMTPGQVLDDAVRYFRGTDGADFGRSLLDNVKQNPMPAAVAGVALAWLVATNGRAAVTRPTSSMKLDSATSESAYAASMRRREEIVAARARIQSADQGMARRDGESEDAYMMRREDAHGYAVGVTRQPEDTRESFVGRIQSFLASGKHALTDGVQQSKDGLRDGASVTAGAVGDYTSTARESISDAAGRAGHAMSAGGHAAAQASSRMAAAVIDSPILTGVLSLAAGALLGALLPQSDTEEAALSGVAGKVRGVAAGLAHDGMDKGSAIAKSVSDAGTASVHDHGLAGEKSAGALVDAAINGDLASDAKQVVTDVVKAADDAVRKMLPEATQVQTRSNLT